MRHQILDSLTGAISAMFGWSLSVNRWQRRAVEANNALMESNRRWVLERGGTEGAAASPVSPPRDLEFICRMPQAQQQAPSDSSDSDGGCERGSPAARGRRPPRLSFLVHQQEREQEQEQEQEHAEPQPEGSGSSISSLWGLLSRRSHSGLANQVSPAPAAAADPRARSPSPDPWARAEVAAAASPDGSHRAPVWPALDYQPLRTLSPQGSFYMRGGSPGPASGGSPSGRRNSWAAGQEGGAHAASRNVRSLELPAGGQQLGSGSFSSRISGAWVDELLQPSGGSQAALLAPQQQRALMDLPSISGRAPAGRLAPLSRVVRGLGAMLSMGHSGRRSHSAVAPMTMRRDQIDQGPRGSSGVCSA